MKTIHVPYIYGGQNLNGFDCSGLVQWALHLINLAPPYDMNAQSLMHYFAQELRGKELILEPRRLCDLAFFGARADQITHVALVLNDNLMLEARGGDSTTKTLQDALSKNARVEVTEIGRRKDLFTILRPYNLPWWGEEKEKVQIAPDLSSML